MRVNRDLDVHCCRFERGDQREDDRKQIKGKQVIGGR
jgi:hypothetical protein